MTILAKLQFGNNDLHLYNNEFLVVSCEVHTSRRYDAFRPISPVRTDIIQVTVMMNRSSDLALQEWYISRVAQSGRLLFEMTAHETLTDTQREILFEDAVCYGIHEIYDLEDGKSRLLTLKFNAEKTIIDDAEFGK